MSGPEPEMMLSEGNQPNESGIVEKIPEYGSLLSNLLTDRKVTAVALADSIGCDPSYTRIWRRGVRVPYPDNEFSSKIPEALGLNDQERDQLEIAQKYSLFLRSIEYIGITLDEARHFIDNVSIE